MNCKHCNGEIDFLTAIFKKGFCSDECKIAFNDLKENDKCEKVELNDYQFPEVSMGGLKKSKENLEKGKETLEDDSGEDFIQDVSYEDDVNLQDEYYEFCMLNDIDI